MKIEVNEHGDIELREVYVGVTFVTKDGEELVIGMRDTGFEFVYEGQKYSAQKGLITKIKQ